MKDILMINHFTQVPGETGNSRFSYIINLLCEKGHNVEQVTSSFSHRTKSQRSVTEEQLNNLDYKLTMLNEPGYPKNVCLQRFYSHWVFGQSVRKYLKTRNKPDVIYCSVPSLDLANVVASYTKKNNISFIIDIQDLWPEAFHMVFNVPIVSDIIFAPMERAANKIYSFADEIIAVSQTYVDRALTVNTKCENGTAVFLGTDLKDFDILKKENIVQKPEDEIWIAYIGTLGHSYDIETVIDALDILKQRGLYNYRFIVMGDGPLLESFEKYAQEKNVKVEFTGRLQYPQMVGRLCSCDIAVNPIYIGAAQSIINKHGDYAMAGLPVINTQESKEYRNLIERYNAGINCGCGNANDVAMAITELINNKKLRFEMSVNHRRMAEKLFDRAKTYNYICEIIIK